MKSEKTKRQVQAEQTKQKIFESAIEEFESRGYDNVAIEDICKKCGISKGTFYVHYKSKDDIIKINLTQKISCIGEKISNYLNAHANSTVSEKLTHYLLSFFELITDIGVENVKGIFIMEPTKTLSISDIYYKDVLFLPELKKIIQEGVSSGIFNKKLTSDTILMYIVSFIVGILYMWCKNDSYPLKNICSSLVPCFIKGICR